MNKLAANPTNPNTQPHTKSRRHYQNRLDNPLSGAHLSQARAMVRYLAEGMRVTPALKRAGISSPKRWYSWLDMSYAGDAPLWIYDEAAQAIGLPCDLCGDLHMSKNLDNQAEMYEGIRIGLVFCQDGCADKWYRMEGRDRPPNLDDEDGNSNEDDDDGDDQ